MGAVEIWRGPERLHLVRRQLALIVGFLALEPSVLVPRDRLVDFLWPEDPPRKFHASLHTRVSELRAALRGDGDDDAGLVIESALGGYRLDVPAAAVDVEQFKSAVRTWRSCDSESHACDVLRSALDMWRGPLFGSWLPGDIYATLSHSLESMRLNAAEDLFGMELRRGNADRIVDDVVALSAANPTREKLFAEELLALHATGRSSEALHQYERWRRSLRRDLGADPSTELQAIHSAILKDDVDVRAHSQSLLHLKTERNLATSSTLPAPRRVDADVPRTLPPDIPDFAGRENELRSLTDALVRREGISAVVAVSGPGGIGKTTLCTRVGHALSNAFPDGQIYLNLHGLGSDAPLSPSTVLARLLRMLGVDGAAVPESLDERAEVYRQVTAPLKLLIILDNAASEDQVLPLLPGGPSCRTLINGRTRIGASFGALPVGLGVMGDDDACVLLERVVGGRRLADEPEAVTELVRRCSGLPLALRIVAAKLASKPHWNVARFVRMLDDERNRLNQLSHAHLDVRTTISFSYRGLGERERTLLRRLCDRK